MNRIEAERRRVDAEKMRVDAETKKVADAINAEKRRVEYEAKKVADAEAKKIADAIESERAFPHIYDLGGDSLFSLPELISKCHYLKKSPYQSDKKEYQYLIQMYYLDLKKPLRLK